jgi:tetratricopeptide (TPR) repeat protein
LYPEALEEAEKAIGKHKLEWRYYSLAGAIRPGSISSDLELVDLQKAEEYFLSAARYAKTDAPEDAARSYMAAGWAAYCHVEMGRALIHAEQAIALHPALAEALFLVGKVYMALGEPDNALPLLAKAIEFDKCYALKAAADGDFQRYEGELREFLETMRQEKMRQISAKIEATLKRYEFWLSRSDSMRRDPVVEKAILFRSRALPLWDLLNAPQELAALSAKLAERSASIRFTSDPPLPT